MTNASFLRVLCLAAATLILGCFREDKPAEVAGGDDYPNGFEALGKKSARARGDSSDWNGFDSIPRSGPGLYDTASIPDSPPDTSGSGRGGPAPKRGADGYASGQSPLDIPLDTLVTRVLDTAKGTVEAVRTQVSDSGTRQVDSTVFVPADPGKPGSAAGVNQVTQRITSADSGLVEVRRFADADGDGFLSPRAGSRNLARVEVSFTLPGGVLETRTRRLAAGADLDFNARGDNLLLSSQFLRVLGGDTLDIVRILDADGDSVLIDPAQDSNLVDIVEERRFPEGNPLVSVVRQVRLVAYEDSAGNYPIRFAERRVFRSGVVLEVSARGLGADSAFRPGAEAHWSETWFRPAADTAERTARAWKVRLAPAAGDFRANVLLGFTVEEAYRKDYPHERFFFDFRCETPVADGAWIAAGDVIAWLSFPGGSRIVFTGFATPAGMQGQLAGPDGKSSAISFDTAGSVPARKP